MKRLLLSALTVVLLVSPAAATEQTLPPPNQLPPLLTLGLGNYEPIALLETPQPKPAPAPEPVVYTVVDGDNLTKIGSVHHVEWQRIWAKNTQLKHPDVLGVGERLTIPSPDEQLSRDLPTAVSLPAETPGVNPTTHLSSSIGGLIGSLGYARAGGNCVNEPGVNNPHDGTNPISWAVLSSQPSIGATALWRGINHTGVVTGIWSNGDIEVRHQNWSGAPITRFPAGAFRGYR